MRRLVVAFAIVSLPSAVALGFVQQGGRPTAQALSASGVELGALDRAASPCSDFYQFACGGWTANHPIPGDRPRWGRFDELRDSNDDILRRVLEGAVTSRDPSVKQIGDYYASCMSELDIEKKGATALAPLLGRIAALANVAALPPLVADLHQVGVNALFSFGSSPDFKDATRNIAEADRGGLGLPDRDYYFREDPKSADIRQRYLEHVVNLNALLGAAQPQAASQAAAVMRLETALAKASLDRVSRRDPAKVYHKVTLTDFQASTPSFDWTRYLSAIAAPPISALNVTEPEFFKALDQLLAATPLEDLKAYLRWHVAHAAAPLLSSAFVDENFRFYSKTLQGVAELRPRWKRCVQYTDGDLGEALGQAFVRETFGPQAKSDTLRIVHEVEAALEADIHTLPWMNDATKKQALVKLHAVTDKIGYPDRWRDYAALRVVRGDALGNAQRAQSFEFHRQIDKINRPVDKTEWGMTPPTVNAYYNPLENNINFPAGILQPPFYRADRDPAVNYGGAGAVVGHELTHGFDDQGRKFDGGGNLTDWWTPDDGKAFEERASCLVEEYAGFTAVEEVKVNGKLTLGENTADNGGVRLALMAYLASAVGPQTRTLDGFTPEQRFFLGYGQIWCESRRPEYERMQAQTNTHSPGRYRVNGVVSNMPEFARAFGCRGGEPMVRQNACRVW